MSDPTVGATELRTGLVLVLEDALPALAAARRELAPELCARGIPLHLTILYPFAPAAEVDAALPRLDAVLGRHAPLAVELTAVETWPGAVFADAAPSPRLRALLDDVLAAFPEHPPYGGEHDEVHPHVTLAVPTEGDEAAVAARARALLGDALPCTARVDGVALVEELEPARWRVREVRPLGAAA